MDEKSSKIKRGARLKAEVTASGLDEVSVSGPEKEDSCSFIKSKKVKVSIGLFLVILIVGVGVWKYLSYMSPEAVAERSEEKIAAETQALLEEVGKLMVLPAAETPVVYEVGDPSVLVSQQPFFNGTVKGDKLIIYPQSLKAILYSPNQKKILNVGPVTADNPTTSPAAGVVEQ